MHHLTLLNVLTFSQNLSALQRRTRQHGALAFELKDCVFLWGGGGTTVHYRTPTEELDASLDVLLLSSEQQDVQAGGNRTSPEVWM